MAKHIFWNAVVMVNDVDLSDHVESVTLETGINAQDAAAMGEIQDYSMPGTQVITDPAITFYQDYAAAKVYATLVGLYQNRTVFDLVLKPEAGATAVTNPEWTVPVFLAKMPVMGGKRGERHMAAVTCKVAGPIVVDDGVLLGARTATTLPASEPESRRVRSRERAP